MGMAPEGDAWGPSLIGERRARARVPWMRVVATGLVVLVAFGLILEQEFPGGLGGIYAGFFPPTATRVVTRTPRPILPTPLPATGLLAAPPTDCPTSAPLDSIIAQPSGFTEPVQLFGHSPVWVPQGYLPQGAMHIRSQTPYPPLGILWLRGPTEHPEVTVRMTEVGTGEQVWWSSGNDTPATPVLDLSARSEITGWLGTLSVATITHAGCYAMDVSWEGGGWQTDFAAGG